MRIIVYEITRSSADNSEDNKPPCQAMNKPHLLHAGWLCHLCSSQCTVCQLSVELYFSERDKRQTKTWFPIFFFLKYFFEETLVLARKMKLSLVQTLNLEYFGAPKSTRLTVCHRILWALNYIKVIMAFFTYFWVFNSPNGRNRFYYSTSEVM
jgi:hypothetical protein